MTTEWTTRCKETSCDKARIAHGYCDLHCRRARRAGLIPARPTLRQRIVAKVVVSSDGCWNWPKLSAGGYGRIAVGRAAKVMVHRAMYEIDVAPIPDGMQIDHLCRNRACCNPDHLEPVTPQENTLRGETVAARNAARTSCPQGHPYSGDNLSIAGKRSRVCNTCSRIRNLARYHRNKTSSL